MKNFKYPLRIKGSFKELIDISKDLVELGYDKFYDQGDKDHQDNPFIYLVTNDEGYNGQLSVYADGKTDPERARTDVSAKDKDLVLALAAMVDDDKPHVGEYVISTSEFFYSDSKPRKIVKVNERTGSFNTEDFEAPDGCFEVDLNYSRKATKEEIINHLMNKKQNGPAGMGDEMHKPITSKQLSYLSGLTGTTENGSPINIINPTKSIEESVVKSRLETLLLDKPELQDALAELFPEVISMDRSVFVEGFTPIRTVDGERILELRAYGDHQYKGFWLSNSFDWEIVKDKGHNNEFVLVPTRKK